MAEKDTTVSGSIKAPGADTKVRILEEAEQLFAENGFSGTGIDQIARQAGIAKSVIYYHFKNKRDLLDSLFEYRLQQAMHIKTDLAKQYFEGPDMSFEKILSFALMSGYMEKWRKLMKIIIMETLKENDFYLLFRMWEQNAQTLNEQFGDLMKDEPKRDPHRFMFETFFMMFMPLVTYTVFKDKWEKRYEIGEEELDQMFIEIFKSYFESQIQPKIWK